MRSTFVCPNRRPSIHRSTRFRPRVESSRFLFLSKEVTHVAVPSRDIVSRQGGVEIFLVKRDICLDSPKDIGDWNPGLFRHLLPYRLPYFSIVRHRDHSCREDAHASACVEDSGSLTCQLPGVCTAQSCNRAFCVRSRDGRLAIRFEIGLRVMKDRTLRQPFP